MAQQNAFQCWAITKLSIAMSTKRQNKVVCCAHAYIHTLKSCMLITAIASCQIKASNLNSRPNNKKYVKKIKEKLVD
jgi:hypothetical protein